MEYRRFEDTIYMRVDRGEEIGGKLKEMAEREQIRLAEVNGLGALDDFTIGLYDVEEQRFHGNHFTGAYELTSLHGTITTKDGEYYAHLHMNAADVTGAAVGGHFVEATVSATAEIVVRVTDGTIERSYDEVTGLNLFAFWDEQGR